MLCHHKLTSSSLEYNNSSSSNNNNRIPTGIYSVKQNATGPCHALGYLAYWGNNKQSREMLC